MICNTIFLKDGIMTNGAIILRNKTTGEDRTYSIRHWFGGSLSRILIEPDI